MSRHGNRIDLRKFVEDLAQNGLRFDLNPTHVQSVGVDIKAEMFWHNYIKRMDESIRDRARAALWNPKKYSPREVKQYAKGGGPVCRKREVGCKDCDAAGYCAAEER